MIGLGQAFSQTGTTATGGPVFNVTAPAGAIGICDARTGICGPSTCSANGMLYKGDMCVPCPPGQVSDPNAQFCVSAQQTIKTGVLQPSSNIPVFIGLVGAVLILVLIR